MNDKLKDAVQTIVEYCKGHESCWVECPFFDENAEVCCFAICDLPCDWDFGGDFHG